MQSRQLLEQPFTKDQIKQRRGQQGRILDYVETYNVIQRLNDAFDGEYRFEILEWKILDDEVIVLGMLTVGAAVRMQFGQAQIQRAKETKIPIAIGDDLKAATSDCFKKLASTIGVALSLYHDDDGSGAGEEKRVEKPTRSDNGKQPENPEEEKSRLERLRILFDLVKSCDMTESDLREKIAQIKGPAKFKELSNVQIKFLTEYFQGVKRSQEPPASYVDETDVSFEGAAPPRALDAPTPSPEGPSRSKGGTAEASGGHRESLQGEGASPGTVLTRLKPPERTPAVHIDVRKVEIPTPQVDDKGFVTKAWMDALPLHAEAFGCIELCANLMKKYPKMDIKQYRDCWDVLAHATAKGKAS